ncbi:YQGE family putative transporter [Aneurinibacillus soli]|uniref:Major Facilitator Superfamily protein n=1 Tax=Aneurinibacillus soli TaxID=1500254 RepID=A0A0U5AQ93_9BACL|nr:MFS transporter [Aneurinibacillus soli]PYE57155.1 YQGE family putative transporter [Aneurinibacillus soli]BAU25989.1 Major Facilitator Superfamily protein [Aneurinibacillus soli]
MKQTGRLNGQAKLLLLLNTLYLSAVGLSNTFVNVYLWKVKNDFTMIGLFNLCTFLAIPTAFWVGGHLAKRWDRVLSIRLGMAVMACFYVTVLFMKAAAPAYIIPLGLLLGTGAGLYWFGYFLMYFEITDPNNRDVFNGVNGLLMSATAGGAPFLAGWLITRHTSGYMIIFSLSLTIFLIAVAASFFVAARPCEGTFRMRSVWQETRSPSHWQRVVWAYAYWGMREGVTIFAAALLVFITASNEMAVGTYALLTSVLSFLAYYAVGKWIRPGRRASFMLIGALMLAAAFIPPLIHLQYSSMLWLGVITSLFYPFFAIPLISTAFDVIGENMEKVTQRAEYIVMREFAFSTGRLTGTVLFLLVVTIFPRSQAIVILLFILNSMLLGSWVSMRAVYKRGWSELEGTVHSGIFRYDGTGTPRSRRTRGNAGSDRNPG